MTSTTSGLCGLTVLVPSWAGALATKAFRRDAGGAWHKVRDYGLGATFLPAEIAVDSLDALAREVIDLAELPAVIVRGALNDHGLRRAAAGLNVNRRIHGDDACLRDADRRWIMLDVDGWVCPPSMDVRDPGDHAHIIDALVHDALPAQFRAARMFYQFSASCGLTDPSVVRVHLWAWLNAPMPNADVRARLLGHCDVAPFSAAQPHFVQNPICENAPDPMPSRHGWRDEIDDEVDLSNLQVTNVLHAKGAGGLVLANGAGSAVALANIRRMADAGMGDGDGRAGFYYVLRRCAWEAAYHAAQGYRDDAAIIGLLRDCMMRAPRDLRLHPDSALERYAADLPRLLDQAVRKRLAMGPPITQDAIISALDDQRVDVPARIARARGLLANALVQRVQIDAGLGLLIDDVAKAAGIATGEQQAREETTK